MKFSYLKRSILAVAVAAGLSSSAQAQKPFDFCADEAKQLVNVKATGTDDKFGELKGNFAGVVNDLGCFIQANQADPATRNAIDPARGSIWNALQSMNSAQQQGSSVSSSASTNAVSKPSGPSSVIEEFGGVNTTSGTSSATVQWAPGTMLTNLVYNGVAYICAGEIQSGCISPKLIKAITPLTFKVTANTSGPSPAVNGTSSGSGTAAAQPVSATSATASKPGFSGLTAQYSFYGSKALAAANSLVKDSAGSNTAALTIPDAAIKSFQNEITADNAAVGALSGCAVFQNWQQTATGGLNSALEDRSNPAAKTRDTIISAYQALFKEMVNGPGQSDPNCKAAVQMIQALYGAVLEARAYEDFGMSTTSSSDKPEFGIEYDLNTPQTSPSSSSVKLSGNWQFGGKKAATKTATSDTQPAAAAAGTAATAGAAANQANATTDKTKELTNGQSAMHSFAWSQAKNILPVTAQPVASAKSPKPSPNAPSEPDTAAANPAPDAPAPSPAKQPASNAKQAAGTNTPPWSITTTGTVEFYNLEPPSTVPSGSHWKDFQFGAELAYLFAPGPNPGGLRKLIGDVTVSGAYSYQDQMSPALLTGPALSDFTGLPSSTTTAYAQRGVIHLGQAKLGFGTGNNMTFPLVFTYSNRSELVVHPTWGLQFGVTYNLSSLLSSFGGVGSN